MPALIDRERAGGLASGGSCRIALQGASGDRPGSMCTALDSPSASTLCRRGSECNLRLAQLAATVFGGRRDPRLTAPSDD
jgi:hypothetical protein